MHTNLTTQHTTMIGGHYYNRRVPAHAVGAFGPQVRIRITDRSEAERLTRRLNDIWAEEVVSVAVDLQTLLAATKSKQASLTEIAKEYVEVRGIQGNPTISSTMLLVQLSGDMAIENYARQDARHFVQTLSYSPFLGRNSGCLKYFLHLLIGLGCVEAEPKWAEKRGMGRRSQRTRKASLKVLLALPRASAPTTSKSRLD